jgi:hypothetical protein
MQYYSRDMKIYSSLIFIITYGCQCSAPEYTSCFNNILGSGLPPRDCLGFALVEDADFVTVDNEATIFCLDFSLELTMAGIVFEHVDHVIKTDEGVIDGNNLTRN